MKFLSNAHTHSTYCDGQSSVEEQLANAVLWGFVSLGFSGHAAQGFDWKYCMSVKGQRAYLEEIRFIQKSFDEWGISPKVYAGLEQDSLVPEADKASNRADFDYIIGSTHYFPEPLDGEWVAVDGSPELLKRCVHERFGGSALAMAEAYFALHGAAVERDRPDIIGHFDLVRKYARELGLDTAAPAYRRAALAALEQARKGCNVLEVNTGNIARGYDTLPYPADFLLDAWRELGGELTLTSDCHNAKLLDCAFEPTLKMLKDKGWKRILRLDEGNDLWYELEITD